MSWIHRTRGAKAVRVFCPVSAETLSHLFTGGELELDAEPALAALVALLRADNPLGDFGAYKAVAELAPGWELFTPNSDARPVLGEAAANASSPTVCLTIYIPDEAPDDEIERVLNAIVAAHPWEVPVIELTQVRLLTRA